jgi:hypothetical protein
MACYIRGLPRSPSSAQFALEVLQSSAPLNPVPPGRNAPVHAHRRGTASSNAHFLAREAVSEYDAREVRCDLSIRILLLS